MSCKLKMVVDMRIIKQFAISKLSTQSALRDVLLNEGDEITSTELISKLKIWLILLKRES
jgi:hypothetical protein